MTDLAERSSELIELSRDLGAEHRQMAILGEGNASLAVDDSTMLIKASGCGMAQLTSDGVVACRLSRLMEALAAGELADEDIEQVLLASRCDANAKKPSVEALFHAYLLSLPGIECVGHTHPIAVNQVLCSPIASRFATGRLFPDEIVCCGPASVFVPYTDPGLRLAWAIRDGVQRHLRQHSAMPRVILLENHGIITLGESVAAVKSAMFMAEKAAQIFIGAASIGGPRFLPAEQVQRIADRRDEHYRREMLMK